MAKHGRGHFVYTGLVFFRQLPAGVPGPTGSSPTWSRSANDAPRRRQHCAAAPVALRGEEAADGATGLPWPRTWPGVYLFVLGCFVAWVVLLVVLERSFS